MLRGTCESLACAPKFPSCTRGLTANGFRGLVHDRKAAHKHVLRAEIFWLSAGRVGTNSITRRTGKSKTCAWRWQERFMQEGYYGLAHKIPDSPAPPAFALGGEVAERVVALTLQDTPCEATYWTGAMIAKVASVSVSSVQRNLRVHDLEPHRVRQYKLSNDPKFVAKLRDVVGLYVDQPAHAIVLSVDEKRQHGTTTLFAALNYSTAR